MRTVIRNPIYYWSSALSDDVCDLIIKEGTRLTANPATINSDNSRDENMRKGLISFFPENCWVEKLVIDYVGAANIETGWKFNITGKEQLQFAKYYEGAFYDWHRDCDVDSELYRKLSVTVQLSDPKDYEGGELQFKNYWGTMESEISEDILKRGTVIVFPSAILHKVHPVTKGMRYSLVQWYNGPDFT